jgi:ABC-2 type transport system ATP-binding protein
LVRNRRDEMIVIEDLTKYYGSVCAVDHISFEIRKGEILGLLGPNGAGKSSTLRMLTCFLPPSAGNITVKDFNIYEDSLAIKRLIGYLPESAPVYHDMLVYDYLRFVAQVRGVEPGKREKRIREICVQCGLRDVMHKPVHAISRGYKQRVGLAHAMLGDPEILVLDEPTAGLDPNQIVEIRDIIKEIGREKTVILSTHILSEAEATCDRVVIIHNGKIVADGATEELKKEAGNTYEIHLSLLATDFEAVRTALSGVPRVRTVSRKETAAATLDLLLTCEGGDDVRPAVYERIRRNDWVLLEFYREGRTLENIFRDLTKEN